jgi:RNA polymerase sigma-70 factor (ECF subfamily)
MGEAAGKDAAETAAASNDKDAARNEAGPHEAERDAGARQDADRHEAFLRLFLTHQGDIRAFVGSMLRASAARDDVVQETALVLWRKFDSFDASRSFGAWARGIAANLVRQRLEREGRQAQLLPPEVLPAIVAAYDRTEYAAANGAGHAAIGADSPLESRRDALELCLKELPDKSRALLAMRYEEGLSSAKAADRIGSTVDAVHKALSRIRLKLEACIERRLRLAGESA